ncbi:MAG: hypothetical protein CL920_36440 [Deltaproteobacteria bacterium]|mgnify:CR=1 FL=1|nr:hypothetical protein [Deltaproteobacteria bacterium]MBU54219.1 hypothetical protein [Deltaproteobacteria bacterium]|tara:strand:+ start:2862 stop:4034 length:1173 start_codon:yes stop_codon:yes gene_type:complete
MIEETNHNLEDRTTKFIQQYPILFVDDERPNRIVFQAAFGDEFDVRIAASGSEALEMMQAESIAVLIADNRMPGMTGIELCEKVRNLHPNIPRILVTAYSDISTVVAAINRGEVFRYIPKPWEVSDVKQTIRTTIQKVHMQDMIEKLQASIVAKERQAGMAMILRSFIHDLSNVSNIVSAACESLETYYPEFQPQLDQEQDQIMKFELRQLRYGVDQTLLFHRKAAMLLGQEQPEPNYYQVETILSTVLHLLEKQLDHITVTQQCRPDVYIWGDDVAICRIILNILTNAIQAFQEANTTAPAIHIEAVMHDKWTHINISDNGPGIPSAHHKQIFQAFYTTKKNHGGNGLGLAICRDLARGNNGQVTLTQPQPPQGSEFLIKLPAFSDSYP